MIPEAFFELAELPRTPNGKLDRKALFRSAAELPGRRLAAAAGFVAPRSELEQQIAAVWREVLGLEKVGVEESFFEAGGHSVLLLRVRARLAELGQAVSAAEIFQHPTVASLAAHLLGRGQGAVEEPALATADVERIREGRSRLAERRTRRER
jgi:hypothetical protein